MNSWVPAGIIHNHVIIEGHGDRAVVVYLVCSIVCDDVTDETVGAVVSTTNVFTLNALLAFAAESVTVMVQL